MSFVESTQAQNTAIEGMVLVLVLACFWYDSCLCVWSAWISAQADPKQHSFFADFALTMAANSSPTLAELHSQKIAKRKAEAALKNNAKKVRATKKESTEPRTVEQATELAMTQHFSMFRLGLLVIMLDFT